MIGTGTRILHFGVVSSRGNKMTGLLDGSHHLRATPRYKLFEPTELVVCGPKLRVHMLNLSVGGALIHGAEPPTSGTRVRLRCGLDHLSAKVAWTNGSRFGLTFLVPLNDNQVTLVLAEQERLAASASRRR